MGSLKNIEQCLFYWTLTAVCFQVVWPQFTEARVNVTESVYTDVQNGVTDKTNAITTMSQSTNNTLRIINTTLTSPRAGTDISVTSPPELTSKATLTSAAAKPYYLSVLGAQLVKLRSSENSTTVPIPTKYEATSATTATTTTKDKLGNFTFNLGHSIKSYLDIFSKKLSNTSSTEPNSTQSETLTNSSTSTASVLAPEVHTTSSPDVKAQIEKSAALLKINYDSIFKGILQQNESNIAPNSTTTPPVTTVGDTTTLVPTTNAPVLNKNDINGILGGLFNVLYKKTTPTTMMPTTTGQVSMETVVSVTPTITSSAGISYPLIGDLLSDVIKKLGESTNKVVPSSTDAGSTEAVTPTQPTTSTTVTSQTTTEDLTSAVKIVKPKETKPPLGQNEINSILGDLFPKLPVSPTQIPASELPDQTSDDIVNGITGQFIDNKLPNSQSEVTVAPGNEAGNAQKSTSGGTTLIHGGFFCSILLMVCFIS